MAGRVLHIRDLRAVAGVWSGGRVVAEDLSWDQTPPASPESEGAGRRVEVP
jgi:hypothetical protein